MVEGYEKRLKALLKENGCYFARSGKGSHEIWYSPITNRNFTVSHQILSRHLANHILKEAGVNGRF